MYYHSNGLMHRIQEFLGITDYTVYLERISQTQVTAEDGNKELVGICVNRNDKVAFLYHTRDLTQEDIVHELVHVAHPRLAEEEVKIATANILSEIAKENWKLSR